MATNLPGISILMINLNSAHLLNESLKRLARQDYPKNKIETLILDAGSTDNSKEIVKKFNAHFVKAGYRDNGFARISVMLPKTRNEMTLILDNDNYLTDPYWLKRMVQPLLDDPSIFCSQTMYYEWHKDDTLFNRYVALFGVNDPVALYLGKADRLRQDQTKWYQSTVLAENKNYLVVKLDPDSLPTVGCNGFLIRKNILMQSHCDPENYFHTDCVLDLVKLGYNKMAVVKNTIWHATASNFKHLLKKRITYHFYYDVPNRRYLVFDPKRKKDLVKIAYFIIATITFVQPLFMSIRGYIKKRDPAWFMHPFVCYFFLMLYSYMVLLKLQKKFFHKHVEASVSHV